jgi:hypothetical protein
MSTICTKAKLTDAQAFYVLGQLIIRAKGTKPTPCHQARVEHWPYRIYPPQYQVVTCIDEGVICVQQLMSYDQIGVFSISQETFDAMDGVASPGRRRKSASDGNQTVKRESGFKR